MNEFREWFSDNLRYFILAFIVIAVIAGAIIGVKLYSNAVGDDNVNTATKGTESESETETNSETESESETATETETESETESESETETNTDSEAADNTQTDTDNAEQQAAQSTEGSAQQSQDQEASADNSQQTEAQVQTEYVAPTEAQPVYKTIHSACYMRSAPEYGDNIIGQYEAGTTVEFLEDVGGWYKVSVDGMVGYMGAKFFN